MTFLKDLLLGRKLYKKKSEIKLVDVPHWDEFNVANLYEKAM